ncbi:MAG: hypothetical protein CVT88_05715 [Candidatus Altiarchaeales archaeon HGW-Altiarchaeales-1]|nr:MAG: hypothetical protein CVT88_05715 [Candidatus Altiarchaeales archaeon HGW-Altiarchaeales-1]
MIMKIKRILNDINQLLSIPVILNGYFKSMKHENEEIKLMMGKILVNQLKTSKQIMSLHDAEFKVFSQWGDDGIIQYLINNIDILNKSFIEFGVENYKESNTRFLLINNNWKGFIMDSSEKNIEQIKNEDIYWKYDLTAKAAFITAENINQLITDAGFTGEIGLLHIDIDGNDYWVWKAIKVVNPIIVIVEYNSVFEIDRAITIPYDSSFCWTNAHYSNLYFGASLLALCDLAEEKGYFFVGCNSNGNNAYFIRKDKIGNMKVLTPKEGYVYSKFRESRDKGGNLNYIGGGERLEVIRGMKIYNTRTDKLQSI